MPELVAAPPLEDGKQPLKNMEVRPASFVQESTDPSGRVSSRVYSLVTLQGWPETVRYIIIAQYFSITCTSVMLGALFDAYLLIQGGSNSFVGIVESFRGLAILCLALPIGWVGDRYSKPMILRYNLFVGFFAAMLVAVGLPLDFMPMIVTGCILLAIHGQFNFALMPPLIAELITAGERRTRAMSHMQTAASLGNASGPAVQIFLILVLHHGQTRWSASELHWILCLGAIFFFVYARFMLLAMGLASRHLPSAGPVQARAQAGTGRSAAAESDMQVPAGRWLTAVLIETTSIVTAVGSGMTFRYWPLFFKGDFGFSPAGVCIMQLSIWVSIAGSAQMSPVLAKHLGRLPTSLLLHIVGTFLLFIISWRSLGAITEVPLVLMRNAIMNAGGPLLQALILDIVPQRHRGKWSSFASLRRMTWSGSAFVGGVLSDSHDYRYAFFITACMHTLSGLILLLVTVLSCRARNAREPATE
mmetsp:Transcript_127045/g.219096  ORF Transcript_127045/g.219096 Transcript_127045/m.219096 type:complete len:474 (-) Transcript_127045:38-1459(-)